MDFRGIVHRLSGYLAYRAFADTRNGQIRIEWLLGTRPPQKIYDALEQSPRTAAWLLGQIQQLYQVEATLREKKAGTLQLRAAVRSSHSRPVVQRSSNAL